MLSHHMETHGECCMSKEYNYILISHGDFCAACVLQHKLASFDEVPAIPQATSFHFC